LLAKLGDSSSELKYEGVYRRRLGNNRLKVKFSSDNLAFIEKAGLNGHFTTKEFFDAFHDDFEIRLFEKLD